MLDFTVDINHINIKKAGQVLLYLFIFAGLIPFLLFFISRSLDRVLFAPSFMKKPIFLFLGLVFMIIGSTASLWSIYLLRRRGKGYPLSPLPPVNLVVSGIYRYSRHPLYAGASLIFLGVSFLKGSFWGVILGWPAFVFFFTCYARGVEEPVLIERYGGRYLRYTAAVPLFFPYPWRRRVLKGAANLFAQLSRRVNRPVIFQYKEYYFFIGYAVWWAIGVFLSLGFFSFFLLAAGVKPQIVDLIPVIVVPLSLVGAHIFWFIEARIEVRIKLSGLGTTAGFTSWGGIGTFLMICAISAWVAGSPPSIWCDCAIPLLLMHFFGRIGCAFYGCCYGKQTHSNICLSYSHPALKAVREKCLDPGQLFPVQVFSAFYGLVCFCIILLLRIFLPLEHGFPVMFGLMLYGLSRSCEEWFRMQKRVFSQVFSLAQFLAISLFISMAALLLFYFPRPDAVYYEPLINVPVKNIISSVNFPLLLLPAAVAAFAFGYHRREIGRWK